MTTNQFSVIRLCLTLFALMAISVETLVAVPAYPYSVEYTQPDGSKVTILLSGDEFIRSASTVDGYTLMANDQGGYEYAVMDANQDLKPSGVLAQNVTERTFATQQLLMSTQKGLTYSTEQLKMLTQIKEIKKKQSASKKAFPTSGSRKLVCILMGYKDLAFTKTKAQFESLFNQVNYSVGGATGSVKDYYNENSHGKLDLSVTIAGPYTADNNMSYYGRNSSGNDANPRALVSEAVRKADADVNYADFDNDNDGSVDGIYVIYAGYGEEAGASSNAIWAHAWSIPRVTLDGKRISRYSCSAELRGNSGSGITRIGVICHEFGHVLGAPDYYDTNYDTGGRFNGTGRWDLMAAGSWNNGGATPAHHNAYTKVKVYNWATAEVLNAAKTLELKDVVASNNSFYQINTTTSGEYFIMENRQQKGFDAEIPGHGLMIYHVHSGVDNVGNSINATYPQRMYPVCASATSNPTSSPSSYGSINSGGCPFPGTSRKGSFTDATTPNARSWAGNNTRKPVTNISEASGVVTFDFMGGGATVAVSGVSVSPDQVVMKAGQTQTLSATVTPTDASNKSVKWSSSNTSIATVSSSGVVEAIAEGVVTITVTTEDKGFTATANITVEKADPVSVTGVSLSSREVSVSVGKTKTLSATVAPSNATNKTVTWSSSDNSVATVDSNGMVEGVAEGTATITVTTEEGAFSQTAQVTVTKNDPVVGADELYDGAVSTGNLNGSNSSDMWYIEVPAGVSSMLIEFAGSGVVGYGKAGSKPTTSDYDWRRSTSWFGGSQSQTVSSPDAGLYFIMLNRGFFSTNYEVRVTFDPQSSSYSELGRGKQLSVLDLEADDNIKVFTDKYAKSINVAVRDLQTVTGIQVVSTTGQIVYTTRNINTDIVRVSDLTSGYYVVRVQSGNKLIQKKVVVE